MTLEKFLQRLFVHTARPGGCGHLPRSTAIIGIASRDCYISYIYIYILYRHVDVRTLGSKLAHALSNQLCQLIKTWLCPFCAHFVHHGDSTSATNARHPTSLCINILRWQWNSSCQNTSFIDIYVYSAYIHIWSYMYIHSGWCSIVGAMLICPKVRIKDMLSGVAWLHVQISIMWYCGPSLPDSKIRKKNGWKFTKIHLQAPSATFSNLEPLYPLVI